MTSLKTPTMAQAEFETQYYYLWSRYPNFYDSGRKGKLYEVVKNMPLDWFKDRVSKLINRGKPEFDWTQSVKSALAEKRHDENFEKFKAEQQALIDGATGITYEQLLKENGVSSFSELFNKRPGRSS
ncbi:MAG: hypothetical protein ACXVB1_00085 [Pseudobdellovibrionaceae bacterium]